MLPARELYDLSKRVAVCRCDLGKHLAIDVDTAFVQAVDQTGIRDAVHTCGSIDACDPQLAHRALFCTSVAVGKLQRFVYTVLRYSVDFAARAVKTFRTVESFLSATV